MTRIVPTAGISEPACRPVRHRLESCENKGFGAQLREKGSGIKGKNPTANRVRTMAYYLNRFDLSGKRSRALFMNGIDAADTRRRDHRLIQQDQPTGGYQ